MEIRTDLLAAALRHAEAAESGKYDVRTSKQLMRISGDYFRRAIGKRANAPVEN